MSQVFIVTEYCTNRSDKEDSNKMTVYNNYQEALKHFSHLQDKIYNDENDIVIRFKDSKYDYHINNDIKNFDDEYIIECFKENNIYTYIDDSTKFIIHKIYTKGNYQEHILSQEGYYKISKGADLKIINISTLYEEINEKSMISYSIPKRNTY